MHPTRRIRFIFAMICALVFASYASYAGPPAQSGHGAVLLKTAPGSGLTELVVQPTDRDEIAGPVATLSHLLDGNVRGVMVDPASNTIAVVADVRASTDPSWGASLFLMAPGQESIELIDSIYTNIPPVILEDGRLLVARGQAGPAPVVNLRTGVPDHYRIDAISLETVDPTTGEIDHITSYQGYQMVPIGSMNGEVFVYRLNPSRAEIVAIDLDTGESRPLASPVLPVARDFSLDTETGTLVYTQRDDHLVDVWTVRTLDTQSGAKQIVAQGSSMALTPRALGNGRIAYNNQTQGLRVQDRHAAPSRARTLTLRPQHAATAKVATFEHQDNADQDVIEIRALQANGHKAAVLKTVPGQLSTPWIVDLESGEATKIPVENGVRVDIMGVTE